MSSHVQWDFYFTWKITEFSVYYPNHLYSPAFTVAALDNSKWFLLLCLQSRHEDFISCFLVNRKNNESDKQYKLTYEIIMILEETAIWKIKEKNVLFKNGDIKGSHHFYRRENLIAKMRKCVTHNLTLRCHIKRKPMVLRDLVRTEAHTLIVKHKNVVPWKVKFSEGNLHTDEKIKFSLDGSFFKIKLSVHQDQVNIVIRRIFLKNPSSLFSATVKVILYANGRELSVVDHIPIQFGNGMDIWIIPTLISIKQLRDNASDYVKDGEILLMFSFSSFLDVVSTSVSEVTYHTPFEQFFSYYYDFRHLHKHEKSKDVILRIDNRNQHPVHKSVLISRSPVFFAMFNYDTLENQTGIVDLVDVDAETLEYFLNFLYTDVFPIYVMNCEKAAKLLILADRYRVLSLIQESVNFLASSLCVHNVLDILVLADQMNQTRLKKTCINFAALHQTEIFSTDLSDWTQENVELHAEICESVC